MLSTTILELWRKMSWFETMALHFPKSYCKNHFNTSVSKTQDWGFNFILRQPVRTQWYTSKKICLVRFSKTYLIVICNNSNEIRLLPGRNTCWDVRTQLCFSENIYQAILYPSLRWNGDIKICLLRDLQMMLCFFLRTAELNREKEWTLIVTNEMTTVMWCMKRAVWTPFYWEGFLQIFY